MNVDIYGIPNCDTMRKARKWLEEHGVAHLFHNYKKEPPDEAFLRQAADALGWEQLLNRRGTSWRRLDEKTRSAIDGDKALALMRANPSLIKRPLLLVDGRPIAVGFDPEQYQAILLRPA